MKIRIWKVTRLPLDELNERIISVMHSDEKFTKTIYLKTSYVKQLNGKFNEFPFFLICI